MSEPDWDKVPTDEEILLARSVLKRMAWVVPFAEDEGRNPGVWSGLVEARRMLTVSVSYLSGFPGHKRHYHSLWLKMLEQDR